VNKRQHKKFLGRTKRITKRMMKHFMSRKYKSPKIVDREQLPWLSFMQRNNRCKDT